MRMRSQDRASPMERTLHIDRESEDVVHHLFGKTVTHHTSHETSKIGMKTLDGGEEFTGESESRNQATLLRPVDGPEGNS